MKSLAKSGLASSPLFQICLIFVTSFSRNLNPYHPSNVLHITLELGPTNFSYVSP